MKMISFNYSNSWQCEHGGQASHKLCEHGGWASLYSEHNYTRLFVEHSYQISLLWSPTDNALWEKKWLYKDKVSK